MATIHLCYPVPMNRGRTSVFHFVFYPNKNSVSLTYLKYWFINQSFNKLVNQFKDTYIHTYIHFRTFTTSKGFLFKVDPFLRRQNSFDRATIPEIVPLFLWRFVILRYGWLTSIATHENNNNNNYNIKLSVNDAYLSTRYKSCVLVKLYLDTRPRKLSIHCYNWSHKSICRYTVRSKAVGFVEWT